MRTELGLWRCPTPWLSTLGMLFALPGVAMGHDAWLVTSTNSVNANETVRVAFVTAEVFPISEHAAEPERVREWVVVHGDERRPVQDYRIEDQELAAQVHLPRPGVHVIALALHPRYIELEPHQFTEYLEDEQAEAALGARRKSNEQDQPGRELYTKMAKTFITVDRASNDTSYRKPVGHALEIIPLSDPCRWSVGDEAIVRVLLDGEPAAGVRVSSGHEGLPPHTYVSHSTTDSVGVAGVKLTRPGLWFLRTHTIRPTKGRGPTDSAKRSPAASGAIPEPGTGAESGDQRTAADWESFWASATFRVASDGKQRNIGSPRP